MAEELPIDIDYSKFLNWLVDRRRVARKWHASLKVARVLLRSAAESMPSESSVAAPSCYFELIDVLNIIGDNAADPPFPGCRETDLFNRYSHPTCRAWAAARSSYENGCAFLAEAAQTLVRNTDVEAPAIRAEMSRLKEVLADCARRQGQTLRAAQDAKERFQASCEEFEIQYEPGMDFHTEIRKYIGLKAPELLRTAVAYAKDPAINASLDYYCNFVGYTRCSDESNSNSDGLGRSHDERNSANDRDSVCAVLRQVMESETEDIIKPDQSSKVHDATNVHALLVDTNEAEATGGSTEAAELLINWGIAVDSVGESASDPSEALETRDALGIDWLALTTYAGTESTSERSNSRADDNPKRATLTSSDFRTAYMNDLYELRTFLSQRSIESSGETKSSATLVLQQYSSLPADLRSVETSQIDRMSNAVEAAINCVSGSQARKLLRLNDDRDAVAQCARDISEKLLAAARVEENIETLNAKRLRTSEDLQALTPKFEALAATTRELIRRTEQCLEHYYRGRKVHILGEINVVFPADDN